MHRYYIHGCVIYHTKFFICLPFALVYFYMVLSVPLNYSQFPTRVNNHFYIILNTMDTVNF